MLDFSISSPKNPVKEDGDDSRTHAHTRALGIIANNVSASPTNTVSEDEIPLRVLRFILQSGARQLLPNERVAHCLRKPVPGAETVDIAYSQKLGRAAYRNLVVCARIWQCPVCAARISEERRKTLSGQLMRLPYQPIMLTYTLSHKRGDKLEALLTLVSDAHRKFRQGRAWQKIKRDYGMIASLRALEVTHGINGWHVHIHEIVLLQRNLDREMIELNHELKTRWTAIVARLGGNANYEHGLDVSLDRKAVGEYVSKHGIEDFRARSVWGMENEVTKSVSKLAKKGGRTPMQLLYDYCFESDLRAGMLFKEYVEAFRGKRQLHPASFADLFGEEDLPDEAIAADSDSSFNWMLSLTLPQWWLIWNRKDYRGHLLQMADCGDFQTVADWLRPLGIELQPPVS